MSTALVRLTWLLSFLTGCASAWPIEYRFAPDLDSEQRMHFETAVRRWNALAGSEVLVESASGPPLRVGQCPGRASGCGAPWFGATVDWDRIPATTRLTVVTHEVGHMLDLNDLPCVAGPETATMCGTISTVPPNVWPADADRAEFERARDAANW